METWVQYHWIWNVLAQFSCLPGTLNLCDDLACGRLEPRLTAPALRY